MANLGHFNSSEHEPSSFDPIPAGEYAVVIVESEMKPTKAGDGSYLNLTLEVLEGDYQGRKIWDILCLEHSNQKTVQIAMGRLSAYCRACGKVEIENSEELHDIQFKVKVGIRKDEQYGDKNTVKEVLWKESTKPDLSGMASKAKATAGADSDDVPW